MDIRRRPPNPKVKVANLEYAIPHSESEPRNILEKIVWEKDKEVELAREAFPLQKLVAKIEKLPRTKNFLKALQRSDTKPSVIAEIKKASPSKGIIREDFDPVKIAIDYEKAGAACISVLTEKNFFKGGFDVLAKIRDAIDLPLLCKDFIFHPYQLYQARAAGADAILLIAAILSDQDLIYLQKIAISLELSILVEVHNSEELIRVTNLGGFSLIGINNRNLKTFETDINVTERVLRESFSATSGKDFFVVSESGLFTRQDLDKVYSFGARAVLVGEALMRQSNIFNALKELIG